MKLPGLIVLVSLPLTGATMTRAADATTPVDYTQRNGAYVPGATAQPEKKAPEANSTVQDKRFDKTVVDKQPAAVGDRRAPIDLKETREKNVRDKDSHTPQSQKVDQPASPYHQRESSISTGGNTTRLPMAAKYQDSLTLSNATTTTRTTAADRALASKVNRFVFRKNAPDSSVALEGAAVTPAAGGAAIQKK